MVGLVRKEDPSAGCCRRSCGSARGAPGPRLPRVADGPWLSYGEVDARANRVANALIARGLRPGEAVSTLLPNCEENLAVWFGIQQGRRGAVPDQPRLQGRLPVLGDQPAAVALPGDRRTGTSTASRLIAGELPLLEHVIVRDDRAPSAGPRPAGCAWEPLAALMEAPDAEPGVEVGWTDDARIMFTSGTTGRSKGAIKQHASDYFSGRTYIEVCGVDARRTRSSRACRSSTPTPRCWRPTRR